VEIELNMGIQKSRSMFLGATSLNNSEKFEDCRTPPLLEHHEEAIRESGCTGNFFFSNAPCHNKVKYQNPLRVCLPNGDTVDSTHTSSLDIPVLSQSAYMAHIFPGMANHDILSVMQIYNE
jgi:hypothetical protein